MKLLKFLLVGILFGVVMAKSEAISWYRIQEMFRFQAFHMYGIIGTAVTLGALMVFLIKRTQLRDVDGNSIVFTPKQKAWTRYILGGAIFGLGWAFTGACPGPMFVNAGYGYLVVLAPIASALLGTFVYGLLREKLPH